MRIVIDLQGAQTSSRFRGIGRYTLSFTKALIREGKAHEFFIVLNGLFPNTIETIRQEFSDILPNENILVWTAPGPVSTATLRNTWRHSVAELIREAFIECLRPDLIYISSFMEGYVDNSVTSIGKFDKRTPIVASLYDLIPLTNPGLYLNPHPLFRTYYLDRIKQLKKATRLLSISEFSRHEGLTCLELGEDAIVNVSSAIGPDFAPAKDHPGRAQYFAEEFGIFKSYILYTGGADDRKNLPRLIDAFSKLPKNLRSTHQLVFAGKLLEIEVQKLLRESRSVGVNSSELKFTGFISDDDLVQLYSSCSVYVFPSWHEGFGLPALEAMACGAPVIGSNKSSLPEVIGNPDALFDPMSQDSITAHIASVLSNPVFRDELIVKGKIQAKRFTWRNCAKIALDEFQSLAKNNLDSSPADRERIQRSLVASITNINTARTPRKLELARLAHCMNLNRIQLQHITATNS